MKTNHLILTATIFFMTMALAACSDSEQKTMGTPPVTAPKEVKSFFETYLPPMSYGYDETPFNFGINDLNNTKCFLINSMEEFKAIAPSSLELPTIDFDKYTLIIGGHLLGSPKYTLMKQTVHKETAEISLNLIYQQMNGASPTIITTFYFWGLYTKLTNKTIKVDVTTI